MSSSTVRGAATRRAAHGARPLRFESLEHRRMLAITVDTLADVVDAGDGVTSLREAIAAVTAGETIDFSVAGAIVMDDALGEFAINKPLTIDGGGAITLDAGHGPDDAPRTYDGYRVFNINDGSNGSQSDVVLRGLSLTGGDSGSSGGGAVANREDLTVADSVIYDNSTDGNGGAISHEIGTLTLGQTALLYNYADNNGGGIAAGSGTVDIADSTLAVNEGNFNGGAVVSFGSAKLDAVGSTFVANRARRGGGVWHNSTNSATVESSTLTSNTATIEGGGVGAQSSATGPMLLRSSIVSQNTSPNAADVFGLLGDNRLNFIGGDPMLGPLQDNGGPTVTRDPLPGSPVIDAARSQAADYSYVLFADLNERDGGPALEAFPAAPPLQFESSAVVLPEATGLRLAGAISNPGEYALELIFSYGGLGGYQKIVDFSDLTQDFGLYSLDNTLQFYRGDLDDPDVTGATVLAPDTSYRLVVTRDAAGQVGVYLNGSEEFSFDDSSTQLAVFSGPDATAWFFQDDASTGGLEDGDARLDSLAVFDRAATFNEVLLATNPNDVTPFDQRGPGFLRIVQTGSELRQDVGAVEFQGVLAPSGGDYNGNGLVDAADYTVWRDTLGQTVEVGDGADGNSNGLIDQVDYLYWRNNFGAVTPPPAVAPPAAASAAVDEAFALLAPAASPIVKAEPLPASTMAVAGRSDEALLLLAIRSPTESPREDSPGALASADQGDPEQPLPAQLVTVWSEF